MDFSFTSEQEDLRREARTFLEANPAPSTEQLEQLGWVGVVDSESFLEAAVLFEELGRVLYDGPYIANEVGDDRRRAARRACARGGRHRLARGRDGDRLHRRARAVREEDRHVPGRVAPGRRRVRRGRARAVARVLGGVVRRRRVTRRPTSRAPRRTRRRPRRRCSRARRRSRCTAGSGSRSSTRCTATTSGRSSSRARSGSAASCARRSPHTCCTRNRRVVRHRRGVRAPPRGARVGGVRVGAARGRRAGGTRELVFDITDGTRRGTLRPRSRRWTRVVGERGDRDRRAARVPARAGAPRQLDVNVVGQFRVVAAAPARCCAARAAASC